MRRYGIQIRGKRKERLIDSNNQDRFELSDINQECFDDIVNGNLLIRVGEYKSSLPVRLWRAAQDILGKLGL